MAFNNASLFAINQFKLPVENALAGLRPDQFFCSVHCCGCTSRTPKPAHGGAVAGYHCDV